MKKWFLLAYAVLSFFKTDIVLALPEGGVVTAGEAVIHQTDHTSLVVGQTTDRAIINWNQFNIAANERVQFIQPSSEAVALNRITGGEASSIFGSLSANGHLFLINPQGILFAKEARVNVAGLTATTLDIKNDDFLEGRTNFYPTTSGSGFIVNQGKIAVQDGGFVFFIAPSVSNSGVIVADGGEVALHARGASDPFSLMVNQSGIIEANSLVNSGGVIRLIASNDVENTGQLGWQTHLGEVQGETGKVIQSGTLNVSAAEAGAAAGEVTLSGKEVDVSGIILAQGTNQGGRVLITSSDQTNLTSNAMVNTSGMGNGHAGNVVIWSDRYTHFEGTVLAAGGETGGNGAAVEVSGFEHLQFNGFVNASAPNGVSGGLLLDPRNITIDSGTGDLSLNNQFGQNPGGDTIITAASITSVTNTGTGVTLQANNDIIVNQAIITDKSNGSGGALTFQAGRSISINANITSDNSPITLTANETAANGVVSEHRDTTKAAVITMASGTKLDAGEGNIVITMGTGSGPGSNSGDIILGDLVASDIKIVNNGTTAGSDILQASQSSLITANSVVLDIAGAGNNGSVGTALDPIRLNVSHVEARSLGSIFLDSTGDVTVGGAILAASIGVSGMSAPGDIELTVLGAEKRLTNQSAITTTGGFVALSADQMALAEGTINAGSGRVTLQPNAGARAITLGTTSDPSGALALSDAELDTITTTGVLQIGDDDNSSPLSIDGPIDTKNVTTMALFAGANGISQREGAPIIEQNLRVESVGPVLLTDISNNVGAVTARVTGGESAPFLLINIDLPQGATIDNLSGITTSRGTVTLMTHATLSEIISERFRSDASPIFSNPRGILSDLRLDTVTDRFVMPPKNSCRQEVQEGEGLVKVNEC